MIINNRERVGDINRRLANGETRAQIAASYGWTRTQFDSNLSYSRRRIGIRKKHLYSPVEFAMVEKMRAQGVAWRKIAKAINDRFPDKVQINAVALCSAYKRHKLNQATTAAND